MLSRVLGAEGRYDEADRLLRRALRLAPHRRPTIRYSQAIYAMFRNDLARSQRLLREALRTGDSATKAFAQGGLGVLCGQRDRYAEAKRWSRLAARRFDRLGDRRNQSILLENLATWHLESDEPVAAAEAARVAAALAASIGDRNSFGAAQCTLADALVAIGEEAGGLEALAEARAALREGGDVRQTCRGWFLTAATCLQRDDAIADAEGRAALAEITARAPAMSAPALDRLVEGLAVALCGAPSAGAPPPFAEVAAAVGLEPPDRDALLAATRSVRDRLAGAGAERILRRTLTRRLRAAARRAAPSRT